LSKRKQDKGLVIDEAQKERRLRWRAGVFFLLVAFVLYGNTISNKYSMDDEYVTYKNEQVMKGFSGMKEIFTSRYTEGAGAKFSYGYRPVVKATYAIENQFFGQNPHISHFINVLLYAITGFVLFMLLKRLLRSYHIVFPFLITLLFMAHPVHTEVVASLKNRDELLSFLGCLLTVRFSINYIDQQKIKYLVFGVISFLLAFFAKIDALTFLAVIPLVAWYFTDASWKKIALYTGALFFCLLACYLLVIANMPEGDRTMGYYENPFFHEKGFFKRLAMGFYSLYFYVKKLVFPHPLAYYYGYNMIPVTGWAHPVPIISFLFFAAAGLWALFNLKKRNILAFAIAYFIITISIFSNIVTPVVGIVAERFMYAASLGFCIVVAYFLLKLSGMPFTQSQARIVKWDSRFITVTAIILALWSIRTITRNPAWKDHLTLYSNDIKYLGKSAKAHDMLGGGLSVNAASEKNPARRDSMIQESIRYYKEALKIYPDFISAHNNLGSIYANFRGDCSTAIPYFERAVELDTAYAQAMFNLAFCYAKTGAKDKAISLYERALVLDPGQYPPAYTNLGQLYFETGQFDKAVEVNKRSMPFLPGSDVPYVNIGNFYLQKKDTLSAVEWWEKGLKVYPNNGPLAGSLARYFGQTGNMEKANYYARLASSAQNRPVK
jgi:protein O-mannosyl-transferase